MNTQPSDGRAEPRVLLMVEGATLRVPGGSAAKVTLRDLSRQGFCTEWPYVLHRGQRVWLKFPDFIQLSKPQRVENKSQFTRVGIVESHFVLNTEHIGEKSAHFSGA